MAPNLAPFHVIAFPAGTTTGTSGPIDCRGYTQLTAWFTSVGTTSGGTIITEEASYDPLKDPTYGGTWSQIASRAASTFTGGVTLAVHFQEGDYAFVRFRISSDVTGGGSIGLALDGTT
jgi:hypothetical protein